MRTVATFNALHLGDNLVHLHFLRALAKRYPDITFTHGAPDEHLAQLAPLTWDLPNLRLISIAEIPTGALNAWRGAGGHWYNHPQRNDFAAYHLDWFATLAARMGLESPFTQPTDLLFDYPALSPVGASLADALRAASADPAYDFLIINSQPQSGQWSGYDLVAFPAFALSLHFSGYRVITTAPAHRSIPCTRDQGMDVTAIGRLSQRVRCIIGPVTGPMWPTLNIWNSAPSASSCKNPPTLPCACPPLAGSVGNSSALSASSAPSALKTSVGNPLRIHLLDTERVELCPNTVHTNSLTLVPELLQSHGLI